MKIKQTIFFVFFCINVNAQIVDYKNQDLTIQNIQGKFQFLYNNKAVDDNLWDIVKPFYNGFAIAYKNGKYVHINKNGKPISNKRYDLVHNFNNEIALVKYKNNWGYITEKGKEIIPQIFSDASDFKNNNAAACIDDKWIVIDLKGKYISDLKAEDYNNYFDEKIFTPKWKAKKHSTSIFNNNYSKISNIQCPPNLDFEYGSFTNWETDTGYTYSSTSQNFIVLPANTWKAGQNTINRQMLQDRNYNPNDTDYYGGFSIHPPNSSRFSVKLGSDTVDYFTNSLVPNAKAEAVRYYINPLDSNYSITFSYAVVFENPVSHTEIQQPRFRSRLYEVGGDTIDCASFTFVASGPLPGFDTSIHTKNAAAIVKFKDWSSVYINLGKYVNKNLVLEFTTADCTLKGHFGYAYLDVNECGIIATCDYKCGTPNVAKFTAPPGFQYYKWYDSAFTSLLGTGSIFLINNPTIGAKYNVIVTPYSNTGCIACNCSDTLSVRVIPNYPIANAGQDKSICIGSTVTIGSSPISGNTYQWSPTNGLSNSQIANPTTNVTSNISYILNATNTLSGCSTKDTVNVNVNSLPVPSFTINQSTQCSKNNSFSFQNTTSVINNLTTFSWDFGDGNSSTLNNPIHQYASSGNYTVKLIATNQYGCRDSISKAVIVKQTPSPDFNINNPNQCYLQNNFLFTSSGSLINSYLWDIGGNAISIQSNPQYSFLQPGSYFIKLVIKGINDCKDSTIKQVNVYPQPTANFNINQSNQCINGNNYSFTNNSTLASGTLNNYWDFGDNVGTSTLNNPIYNYSTIGQFIVKLKTSSNYGCIDSLKKIINILPKPNVVFTLNNSNQCLLNNNFQFSNSSSINSGTIQLTWNFGDNTFSNQNNPSHSYSIPGLYNIKLVALSNEGCKDSIDVPVNVYPQPTTNFTINQSNQCINGNNYSFTNNSTIASGTLNNIWDFGDNVGTSNLNSPFYNYSTVGQFIVKLKTSSNFGCVDSLKKVINIFPKPNVVFNLNSSNQCLPNNNFQFTNSSSINSGTNLYTWSFGDNTFSNQNSPSHSYNIPGSYNVKLVAVSNEGCRDSINIPINVFDVPQITTAVSQNVFCFGDSTQIISNALPGSGSIILYEWFKDGNYIPNSNTTFIKIKQSGKYYVKVTNSNGCTKNSIPDSITVNPIPVGNILPPSSYNICEGYNITLNATQGFNYQWYKNDVIIPSATSNNLLAYDSGKYTVKFTNQYGCVSMASNFIALKLISKPIADFNFTSYCIGLPINLINLSSVNNSGGVKWDWNFGDATTSNMFNPQHTFNNIGNYQIKLLVSSNVCAQLIDSISRTISIVAPPSNIRYPTVNAVINKPHQLQARNIGNLYSWRPTVGLNFYNIENPIFTYNRDLEYLINIKLPSGCLVVDTSLVRVFKEADIYVPRAWSPNNDGHNDKLYPIIVGMIELKKFRIFNRWGQLMFETSTIKDGWDGIFNKVPQPNDTYTWILEAYDQDGNQIKRNGNSVLMR